VSCAKTAEPIEIPFGLCTLVGPSRRVLDGVPGAIFSGKDMPGHAKGHSAIQKRLKRFRCRLGCGPACAKEACVT